jgi:predicted RNA-binding protein YlqC (UPF0109 family)
MEEELVRFLAENLVNDPTQVKVERRDAGRTLVLELNVAQEDMGRVIGKGGRVANAMRTLLRAVQDETEDRPKRVVLEIE